MLRSEVVERDQVNGVWWFRYYGGAFAPFVAGPFITEEAAREARKSLPEVMRDQTSAPWQAPRDVRPMPSCPGCRA